MIGHAVEPAIKPLGFNWKIGIGLITSLAAREVIVSTLGTIYGIEDPSAKSAGLAARSPAGSDSGRRRRPDGVLRLRDAVHVDRRRGRRETGGWRWPVDPVRLHDRYGVRVRVPGEHSHYGLVLADSLQDIPETAGGRGQDRHRTVADIVVNQFGDPQPVSPKK